MAPAVRVLVSDLSLADIRRLLAAKEKMVVLEEKKSRLESELTEVNAALIRENGKPMAFQAILGAINKRKLVRTRSGNFANVLRRTLSTSERIKRVARGTYAL